MSTSSNPPEGVVVMADIYNHNSFISWECQFGVHHACPGGLKGDPKTTTGTGGDWVCHCRWEVCPCSQTT